MKIYSILAERVRYFKESEGGIEAMSRVMEEMRDEAKLRERKIIAVSLWNDGIQDIERIARLTNLSPAEVREAIGMKSA